VAYDSDCEEDCSVLRSKRSGGKTTGRRQLREHVISLIEYCSNEVGLAIYNISNGEIHLCQIIERLTYFRTISTIERFLPLEILYSSSLEYTPLVKKLSLHFRNASFKPLRRMLFDETKGFSIYSQRGNRDSYNPDNKFIAYSALHALIFHLENDYQHKLVYTSLNIKWHMIEDLLVIESQTIRELEIFLNGETRSQRNCFVDEFSCLTQGGKRMLRANLLQPLGNEKAIK
jgi:DNA mismatch repair ATPase MutS